MRTIRPLIVLWAFLGCAPIVGAADDLTVAFYGADWTSDGAAAGFYHAFLCISYHLNTSIKEDCYGFYPAQGSKALIGGPGKIGQTDIRRISDSTLSTAQVPITLAQRQAIFTKMKAFDQMEYQLNYSSCIDFVDSIVKMLELKAPARSPAQKPADYVKGVKQLNGL